MPEKKIRAGAISATIWNNANEKGTYSTVQLEKSYKDKDNNWKTTRSFAAGDLPKALLVLEKAYEHIMLRKGGSDPLTL